MVARPYTPCSRPDTKGVVDFVIKEYPAPNGIMSRHLCSLKPGDVVKMKGPWKKLKYEAGMKKKIGMIAGGTGITPMLQIIQAILDNPADTTEVSLCLQMLQKMFLETADSLLFFHDQNNSKISL